MSSSLRVAWTLARVVLHILFALVIVGLLFPFASITRRRAFVRWWSGRVLTICRVRLHVIEPPVDRSGHDVIAAALRPGGIGAMLVMNHISWLDIFVVQSLRTARFIAKDEIAHWPLLGFLTDRTGAVFIERGKRRALREANRRVAELLVEGELVCMFPEGAVSDGTGLLPFHGNLIQPAIDAGTPVVVGGLRYRERDGRRTTATDYVGDVTLFQSIVRIARHEPLVVELHLVGVLEVATTTRHEVARSARAMIGQALGFDDERAEAVATHGAFSRGVAPADTEPRTAPGPRDGSR